MSMMNYEEIENAYINYNHGLELYPDINKGTRKNENGIVFLERYYILKFINGELTAEDISTFETITKALQSYDKEGNQIKGLYDRGAGESLSIDKDLLRLISHDNITSIASFSFKHNLPFAKHIIKHALKNKFRFDNAYPENPRWIFKKSDKKWSSSFQWHPRDWAFWGLCGEKNCLWYTFFIVFFISQIITCLTPYGETSGKLLMFDRLENTYKKSKLSRFTRFCCYSILRMRYGKNWIGKIMKIYFWQSNHPNARLSKDLEL